VSALEADILAANELPASTRDALGTLHDKSLLQRVQPILAATVPANRAEVISRYAEVARRRGDAARGAGIFKQNCQTCHAMQGVGPKVGPDLSSVASRQSDLLIADIFDPSQQVSPDYINYLVVTTDGRVLNGLIAGETTESVTLRREEGQQETVLRRDIEELRATGRSLMPDGLEKVVTPEQLADLLEFLRHPEAEQSGSGRPAQE
jgi:putative heme-binding domain-containing protein